MSNKVALSKLFPVMFGFFIMGFCDLVGIATSFVKVDFQLSESASGFLPSMVFLWFLLISIPASVWMNRIGRKNMVIISLVITFVGVIIPYVVYSFASCLIAFALIGIGNTILQVALNPLLSNIVHGNNYVSALTGGQFIKAISSFCAPLIAAFAAKALGMWSYIFVIYAVLTLLSLAWLSVTPIEKEAHTTSGGTSFADAFRLLKNRKILLLFGGIVFIVGADVGMNTISPKLLIEYCGKSVEDSAIGSSVYFLMRTAGTFLGIILLKKFNPVKYFRVNILLAAVFFVALSFVTTELLILSFVGLIGFACATVFSVIYSKAVEILPEKTNEISGLMITGVCGGAVIPPLMGFFSDLLGGQNGSLIVIAVCILYLVFCAYKIGIKESKA
ncbi:MAG: MFS transporter [Dysgonomonas sp.]|nr:MFS transporter [Dysgonomonas sp.]